MIDQLKVAYSGYQWVKALVFVGILLGAGMLYMLSGGFPPWAWMFLWRVLPQLPRLWEAQGTALVLPLLGLVLLSISLLIIWCVLIIALVKVAVRWWSDFHSRQHFAMDLQEAEQLAEQLMVSQAETAPALKAVQQPAMQTRQHTYAIANSAQVVHVHTQPTTAPSRGRQYKERRVSVPPLTPSMREQLRLVPPVEETSDDNYSSLSLDKLSLDDEEMQIDALTTLPDIDSVPTLDKPDIDNAPTLDEPFTVDEQEDDVDTAHENSLLRLIVGVGLDPGLTRRNDPNEDNLFAFQGTRFSDGKPVPAGLFMVADGMGGHANGREASHMAVHAVSDAVVPTLLHDIGEVVFSDLLKEGAHRANLAIYQQNRQQQYMMGTTLTAALIIDNIAYIVNVGDSRTYLYRPSEGLTQVTRDHSIVARMVEDGLIEQDDIYTHPRRNQIYRCLGERAAVDVDTFTVDLSGGDILLLCSDGLWEMVRDPAIARIISSSAPYATQISAMLIQAALNHGGADNVSVVVVCVESSEK